MHKGSELILATCTDPENFVRGVPNLTFFFFFGFDEGRKDPNTTVREMAFCWRADNGPTLHARLVAAIFQKIRTCIARKSYTFVILQGRSGPPVPPLDAHMSKQARHNPCEGVLQY